VYTDGDEEDLDWVFVFTRHYHVINTTPSLRHDIPRHCQIIHQLHVIILRRHQHHVTKPHHLYVMISTSIKATLLSKHSSSPAPHHLYAMISNTTSSLRHHFHIMNATALSKSGQLHDGIIFTRHQHHIISTS
jgi:hypothetical protein